MLSWESQLPLHSIRILRFDTRSKGGGRYMHNDWQRSIQPFIQNEVVWVAFKRIHKEPWQPKNIQSKAYTIGIDSISQFRSIFHLKIYKFTNILDKWQTKISLFPWACPLMGKFLEIISNRNLKRKSLRAIENWSRLFVRSWIAYRRFHGTKCIRLTAHNRKSTRIADKAAKENSDKQQQHHSQSSSSSHSHTVFTPQRSTVHNTLWIGCIHRQTTRRCCLCCFGTKGKRSEKCK